jgi:5-methylcytosine-specific restriction endonuclease McrA
MEELEIVKRLTDDELVLHVRHCVREDRRVSAQLLAHLGEIEARGLHRDLGYESMFEYAVRVLHMSDSEAGLRIHTARFARKFPDSLEMLSRGELHLTAMKLLAPVLTPENAELLNMACLKTKQEIQLLIAKHCPQPDVPDVVRRLPSARTALAGASAGAARARNDYLTVHPGSESASQLAARLANDRIAASGSTPATGVTRAGTYTVLSPSESRNEVGQPTTLANTTSVVDDATLIASVTPSVRTVAATCLARSEVERSASTSESPLLSRVTHSSNREPAVPLSEGRYKILFTAGQRVRDLLQEAQDLFRNQLPDGDIEVLFERALELLVSERKKQLYAQTDKPRRSADATSTDTDSTSKQNSRHIPSAIKRRVYARDKGQCRFVSPTGERCCARSRLEFHHIQAFGFGGPPTEQNIVLFCRAHNALMAERDFSREHIQRCIRASQAVRTKGAAAKPSAQAEPQLPHAGPSHAKSTHPADPELLRLSAPQHKSTRSGISESPERNGGLNQPRARRPESEHGQTTDSRLHDNQQRRSMRKLRSAAGRRVHGGQSEAGSKRTGDSHEAR